MTQLPISSPMPMKTLSKPRASKAANPRLEARKKIRDARKNIVDSAPVSLYVQFTLPNCECSAPPPDGHDPFDDERIFFEMRNPRMAAHGQTRRLAARRLYEHDHLSLADIAAECGVTRATIARWAKADQWKRIADTKNSDAQDAPLDRRALVARAWKHADRQLKQVENRLKRRGSVDVPLDESARLIATLVKTLRELAALDRALLDQKDLHAETETQAREAAAGVHAGELPRDADTLYEELAARMDRLRQDRDSHGTSGRTITEAD